MISSPFIFFIVYKDTESFKLTCQTVGLIYALSFAVTKLILQPFLKLENSISK